MNSLGFTIGFFGTLLGAGYLLASIDDICDAFADWRYRRRVTRARKERDSGS
jgi:hypothetical protein